MKTSLSDIVINLILKGGILLETKEFESVIEIPTENLEEKIKIKINCKDLSIRKIKEAE